MGPQGRKKSLDPAAGEKKWPGEVLRTDNGDFLRRGRSTGPSHIGALPMLARDLISARDYERHELARGGHGVLLMFVEQSAVRSIPHDSAKLRAKLLGPDQLYGEAHTTTINNQVRGRMNCCCHRSLRGRRRGKEKKICAHACLDTVS